MPRRNNREPEPARSPLRIPNRRLRLFAMTDGHCYYCGIALTMESMTADHVIPRSKGGMTTMANLVPACERCNRMKASHSIDQFRLFPTFRKRGFYGDQLPNDDE